MKQRDDVEARATVTPETGRLYEVGAATAERGVDPNVEKGELVALKRLSCVRTSCATFCGVSGAILKSSATKLLTLMVEHEPEALE